MNSKKAIEFKKRLMFLKGEDLYFLTYNILVLLHGYSCESSQKPFLDHTKLAYLIDFVADNKLVSMLNSSALKSPQYDSVDKAYLQSAYTEGLIRRHIVSRLFYALERKGIVSLEMKNDKKIVAIWLKTDGIPTDFFKTELYDVELENVSRLREALPQLRTMTISTMLKRLYSDNGVATWHE
ncbi:MAG: hypothetical protein ABSA44_11940 [Bacteroidota bacterium]